MPNTEKSTIRVKYTKAGLDRLHENCRKYGPSLEYPYGSTWKPPKTDKQGYARTTLIDLIREFWPYVAEEPFVEDMQFEEPHRGTK